MELDPRIRTVLTRRTVFELYRLADLIEGRPDQQGPHILINELLVARPAFDGDPLTWLTDDDCASRGITPSEACSMGLVNLRASSVDEGVVRIAADLHAIEIDHFNPSRLLLSEWWSRFPTSERLVALAPYRNTLLFADGASTLALEFLCIMAEKAWEQPATDLLCPVPLVRDRRIDLWVPPRDHPLHRRMRKLALRPFVDAYEQMIPFVQRLEARDGRTPYVNKLRIEELEDGRVLSTTSYLLGTDALVPPSDIIALPRHDREDTAVAISFARFADTLGDELVGTTYYPPLYRVPAGSRAKLEALI